MNLDELLNCCALDARYMRDDLRGDANVADRIDKLIALVRKLREQRDSAFEDLWRERGDGWLGEHHEQATEKANAALDEIVRGS